MTDQYGCLLKVLPIALKNGAKEVSGESALESKKFFAV